MNTLYSKIVQAKINNEKKIALLLDPEKIQLHEVLKIKNIKQTPISYIFVGGSTFNGDYLDELMLQLKKNIDLPIFIFPGNASQIAKNADALLFLSLLSGRNPKYLIEQQIEAVSYLEHSDLEVISTAYLLIDGGIETAVQRVSETIPISNTDFDLAYKTAKAGEYLGSKLIYLEAGSGAKNPVPIEMIQHIASKTTIPLLVGGGIRTKKAIDDAFDAGATIVVIGTAFEEDNAFFKE
jgi:phosphoglycerol geranylgeranyltransferase